MTSVCFLSGAGGGGDGTSREHLLQYKTLSAAPQAVVLNQGSSTEPQGQKNYLSNYFLSSPKDGTISPPRQFILSVQERS